MILVSWNVWNTDRKKPEMETWLVVANDFRRVTVNGHGVPSWGDENLQKSDSGDGCPILWLHTHTKKKITELYTVKQWTYEMWINHHPHYNG